MPTPDPDYVVQTPWGNSDLQNIYEAILGISFDTDGLALETTLIQVRDNIDEGNDLLQLINENLVDELDALNDNVVTMNDNMNDGFTALEGLLAKNGVNTIADLLALLNAKNFANGGSTAEWLYQYNILGLNTIQKGFSGASQAIVDAAVNAFLGSSFKCLHQSSYLDPTGPTFYTTITYK